MGERSREAIIQTKMEMYGKHSFPGRRFIVEGIDGSGKSTQFSLLHCWLESEGHAVVFSESNCSPLVKKVTGRGKKKIVPTPMANSQHESGPADRNKFQMLKKTQNSKQTVLGFHNSDLSFSVYLDCALRMSGVKGELIASRAPMNEKHRQD
jgi:energy-coupling factor transporter ATP-binding protein EcfA2